jgi:hypothetical protein
MDRSKSLREEIVNGDGRRGGKFPLMPKDNSQQPLTSLREIANVY